jgi:bifunctional UDP-N-acetylglucosamine pyrophosphorylase/glucosamine-1-phosphate N-acetyltransferase
MNSQDDRVALIVLAAGAGTRMKSSLPKPLHPVAGSPMLWHVLKAGASIEPVERVVVLSPSIAEHPAWNDANFDIDIAIQDPPLGTADAVKCALKRLQNVDWLLILFADHPLLRENTVRSLVEHALKTDALVTILTCHMPEAAAYARIDRDVEGRLLRIVERKDDDPANRIGPIEINSGMMVVNAVWARNAIERIEASPVTQELYLPELVRLAVEGRDPAGAWPVESVSGDQEDLLGINDRLEQSQADEIIRRRIKQAHMLNGVSMILPDTIVIDDDVVIGTDTSILPYTIIESGTTIGSGCRIGPNTHISRSSIGNDVQVRASTIVNSTIADKSDAGPYAHLRDRARIGSDVHIGNYAELKNVEIGTGTRVGHFSYLGDATIGERTNIGAGTVVCNYDGVVKHHTIIGSDVFIGSDSMLVAPLVIGDRARTGAGAVVTRDVPEGATVVGVPAKPLGNRPATSAQSMADGDDVNKDNA